MIKLNELPLVQRIRVLMQIAIVINLALSVVVVVIIGLSYYLRSVAFSAVEEIMLRDNFDIVLLFIAAISVVISLVIVGKLLPTVDKSLRRINRAINLIKAGKYTANQIKWQDPGIAELFKNIDTLVLELENSRKAQKNLIAGIAHELNTPLTTMRGHIEGITEGVFEITEKRIEVLESQISHLQLLVRDLMDISQAEAGTLRLQKTLVDSNATLEQLIEFFEPLLQEKAITLTSKFCIPTARIQADEQRFKQIFINLITNAIRYSNAGAKIAIETNTRKLVGKGYLIVIVKDSGIGISPEDLPQVFEYFFRADRSRSRESGGRGIGLALVKQLVAAHGGRIFARSVLGIGSSFVVVLPVESKSS